MPKHPHALRHGLSSRPVAPPAWTASWLVSGWSATRTVIGTMLGLWVGYVLAVQMFAHTLNRIIVPVLALPLGVCLAAQGAVIVFLVALYFFARRSGLARSP